MKTELCKSFNFLTKFSRGSFAGFVLQIEREAAQVQQGGDAEAEGELRQHLQSGARPAANPRFQHQFR